MPKKQPKRIKRKSRRQRSSADWSGPATKHGPFGLFSNVRLFYIVGIIIMVGSLALGGSLCRRNVNLNPTPTPTPIETETPTPPPDQITPTPTVEQVKQWAAPPEMTIDTAKSYTAKLNTSKGVVEVQLFAADAPSTVNNFVFLAQQGFFKNMAFYYADSGSFAATGDPAGNGKGGPGYELPNEPNSRTFSAGALGMFSGETTGMRAGSRFFIVLNPSRLDSTDFWPFGEVKSGMDVVQSLVKGDTLLSVDIQVQ
jgi:cyclophilin family peptidyl-prolyl cis-trans isomerase